MIENSKAIDDLIKNAVRNKTIPGISYSLISEDEIEEHYIGYQGSGVDHIPLRPDMFYDLASLTKLVGTTTRIFQLLGTGTIKLTDSIDKFISDTDYPQITIENLLMHNSGLPADIENNRLLTRDQLIASIKHIQLISPVGEKILYSDLGYILLGWIIEHIDGDLSQSLSENVFQPLEMTHTGYNPILYNKKNFVPTEYQKDRGGMIRGSVHDHKAYVLNGVSGHAGLFSTLTDLDKFVSMYLNSGSYHDKVIVKPEILDLLKSKYQNGRTLGWRKWNPEKTYLWHTGFTGTSIAIDMTKKMGFVCLTNRVYPDRSNTDWLNVRLLALELFFNESEKVE